MENWQEIAEENLRATPWPSIEEYGLAHKCSSCGALPGELCNAPAKRRASLKEGEMVMHLRRQTVGYNHYRRDVRNAPWPEYRVHGQRYDTLTRSEPIANVND